MFFAIFFISLFISKNVLAESSSSENLKLGRVPDQNPETVTDINYDTTMRFPKGIVPYFIETASYDYNIEGRIKSAMDLVEASSCVVFKQMQFRPVTSNASWVHFTNPEEKRECVHGPDFGINGEIIIVIGYECMMFRHILHAVLHGIGFKDEVSHPHRDQYIRIMWGNIQPGYWHLFRVQQEDAQYKVVEYDPMSIMHFHERAFSINGGPTIAPRLPGLRIKPSEKLSQLDVMKLSLWFGHECNKRKVGALLENCKTVFHKSQSILADIKKNDEVKNESVDVDNIEDPYAAPDNGGMGEVDSDGTGPMTMDGAVGGAAIDGANITHGELDGDGIGGDLGMVGGDESIDGGDGSNDGGDGGMAEGDGNVAGSDGGVAGGDGGLNEGDEGIDGGDGNDIEGDGDMSDGKGVDGDEDANAVADDGVRRKFKHK